MSCCRWIFIYKMLWTKRGIFLKEEKKPFPFFWASYSAAQSQGLWLYFLRATLSKYHNYVVIVISVSINQTLMKQTFLSRIFFLLVRSRFLHNCSEIFSLVLWKKWKFLRRKSCQYEARHSKGWIKVCWWCGATLTWLVPFDPILSDGSHLLKETLLLCQLDVTQFVPCLA